MHNFIIGTSAYPTADADLMKEAGFGWVRQGFGFPFTDKLNGTLSERYRQSKAAAEGWIKKGFKVMGITPLLGSERSEPGTMNIIWNGRSPDWMGELGSDQFAENYRRVCAFLARDLKGIVPLWQIGNEWDAKRFSGPLGLRRSCDLVFSGAEGLKEGDRSLRVGTNTAGIDRSFFYYGRLYGDPRHKLLDYCGVDQYFGSWQAGGPDTWDGHIAELTDITGKPLLVNEWGFSSYGEVMNDEEMKQANEGSYYNGCMFHKWPFVWGAGHTPAVQGEYIQRGFEVFNQHRDKIIGLFYYRWEDQEKCWCGLADCPSETRWGIVDLAGKPKPGYHAFKAGVEKYFKK